jgi:O-antigen ligase
MSRLTNLFAVVFVAAVLFPVLTGADSYLYKSGFLPPLPSFFLLLTLFIPVLFKSLVINEEQELFRVYRNTGWLTFPFGMLVLVILLWGIHQGANWDYNGRIIYIDLYHWGILILSIGVANLKIIRKFYRLIFFVMLIGSSASIWIDMFSPGFFSTLTHRAAGFYSNPNVGALSVILLGIAAIDWKKHDGFNLVLLILIPICIYPTMSVGGLILFLITLAFYMFWSFRGNARVFRKLARVTALVLLLFFLVLPVLIELSDTNAMFDNRTAKNRIEDVIQLGQGDLSYIADHGRFGLVFQYLEIIADAPIIGHGTGYTAFKTATISHGTHNMYLKHWVEQGILGFFLYFLLIGGAFYHFMVLKDRRGMIFVIAFIVDGFFDHNLLENRTLISLLGILGAFAYLENTKPFSVGNSDRKRVLQ